jgi:hypothetical protein
MGKEYTNKNAEIDIKYNLKIKKEETRIYYL